MRLVYERDKQGYLRDRLGEPSEGEDAGADGRMDWDACRAVLRRNHVGRLGFARFDVPVLLPVNYAVDDDDCIVFRTARGSKLWVAENEILSAAFEVDEHDPETGAGVAVVVTGPMTAVTDVVDSQRLARLGLRPWADAVDRPTWIRVTPRDVEGWVLDA